tara:strand:- start:1355 stop:2551 length:1197 start_codon:yes stop_codon:yes gene_type:complete
MNFKGQARRLESLDISRLAHTIGCGEDHLHAVMEVETRGGGFDNYGRLKMLFEPHVFYRELEGNQRAEAIAAGIAYRRWGEQPYPNDSYPRLKRAMEINAEAALKACSWGLGQIMGFNHKLAGYPTVTAMVQDFLDDEDTHLKAMVTFIVSNSLDDELRREDWRGFARGYNGAGYAKHGYHLKLKKAFDKWQRIPDTPFEVDRTPVDPNPPEEPKFTTRGMFLKKGMRGPDVENLQGILKSLGYPVGAKDGIFGRLLHSAVVAFQSENNLVPDGKVGELTWEAIGNAQPRPPREHTEATLRRAGSTTIKGADTAEKQTKVAAASVGGLGTLQVAKEGLEEVRSSQGLIENMQTLLVNNWPILSLLAVAGVMYFYGPNILQSIRDARVKDAVEGGNLSR